MGTVPLACYLKESELGCISILVCPGFHVVNVTTWRGDWAAALF